MYFVFVEFVETEKFQYLKIQKNGSSSICEIIENSMDFKYVNNKNLNKIRWTVIRDPYERFVSGLQYDLTRQKLNLEDININEAFVSNYLNPMNGLKGNMNHATSQVPFLINTDINYYIDIKDLDIFLNMHFNKTLNINKTECKLTLDRQEIMKHLVVDYQVYNQIQNTPYLWKWQQGKIF